MFNNFIRRVTYLTAHKLFNTRTNINVINSKCMRSLYSLKAVYLFFFFTAFLYEVPTRFNPLYVEVYSILIYLTTYYADLKKSPKLRLFGAISRPRDTRD